MKNIKSLVAFHPWLYPSSLIISNSLLIVRFWSDFCFSRSLRRLLAEAVKSLPVLLFLYQERIYGRAVSVPVFCYNLSSLQWAYLQANLFSNECDTPTSTKKGLYLFTSNDANSGLSMLFLCHVVSYPAALVCLCNHKDLKWCSTQNIWFVYKTVGSCRLERWLLQFVVSLYSRTAAVVSSNSCTVQWIVMTNTFSHQEKLAKHLLKLFKQLLLQNVFFSVYVQNNCLW